MPLRTVIFDCDGVLLESVPCKGRAFVELFSDRPQYHERILALHEKLGGVSRFEKIRLIYRDILCEPLTEQMLKELGDCFSIIVREEMLRCALVTGVHEALAALQQRMKLFVATAAPEKEQRDILAARGLNKYFTAVYGTPLTKEQAIQSVVHRLNVSQHEVLFVGDAEQDLIAARKTGVQFLGRIRQDYNAFSEEPTVPCVHDMTGVIGYIDEWSRMCTISV